MELEPTAEDNGWDRIFSALQNKYPSATRGILFCVHKLQQDRELRLTDFRDEAKLHGISLGGRSLHSAKVLLGMEKPSVRRTKKTVSEPVEPVRFNRRSAEASLNSASAESTLIQAVKQIQEAASSESQDLRKAIREAIAILQRAL